MRFFDAKKFKAETIAYWRAVSKRLVADIFCPARRLTFRKKNLADLPPKNLSWPLARVTNFLSRMQQPPEKRTMSETSSGDLPAGAVLNQALLDMFPNGCAVLGLGGRVVLTNESWRQFVRAHGRQGRRLRG